MAGRVGILSPHYDDAVLSCWTVLRTHVGSRVVNVFAGLPEADHGPTDWDRLTGAESPRDRVLERRGEDAEVLERVGAESVNLDFVEDQYRPRELDTKPLVHAIERSIKGCDRLYAPAAIGGHPDHLLVRSAAIRLLARGVDITLYADIPYCNAFGWPAWMTDTDPDPYLDITADWRRTLDLGEVSVQPEDAQVEKLSEEDQRAKLGLVRGYRSQWSGLERGPIGAISSPGVLAFEAFWPLEAVRLTRSQAARADLTWRLGVRRGSRLERATRHPILRRLRPRAGSRLGRRLRLRGTRG